MTAQDLFAQHTRGLFPYEEKFTWVRCVNPGMPGEHEVGDVVAHYGFPAVVTARYRSGFRGIPDRFEVHAWVPTSMAAEELAAGRFVPAAVQPPLTSKE